MPMVVTANTGSMVKMEQMLDFFLEKLKAMF
jgi:hypothetical protein